MKKIIEEINKLKKQKNAVILAHCYQGTQIDEVADFIGDSLQLSRNAAETNADIIVFAGVKFMAETAKLLSPEKKVLLANGKAGCKMADMIDADSLKEFQSKHPGLKTVCYVNSSAEVKALCDICCTSANAVNIVKSLGEKKVLFVPDQNLGNYVASQLRDTEVITFDGYCHVHHFTDENELKEFRQNYPDGIIAAHPECPSNILKLSDFTGSTTGIMKFVQNSDGQNFMIVTEKTIGERLKKLYPEKNFVTPKYAICPNMRMTTLDDILDTLQTEQNVTEIDEECAKAARLTITRMLEVK